ncbi:response regulator transcription factor [Mastigocoleus testarum]|uniref:Two-component system response regulator n=1 Tax=Mastigocoleus testarum BC008 TaxID=371196 RepID=A0A0V7ZP52_9CYAN|nr:response regulator [Mastigocoleus testarum]KST66468.1 two-component system response regulator [Mastigocoleus testarum BC008]
MATVLVVDDTPSQLELMNVYLQDGGYHVITASDAKDALLKAESYQPDVILTDVVMPGMSGFEFCRQLKRNPVTQNLPIIICSSKNKQIDKIWGMRQGADIYLTKPFSKQELIQALKSVLDSRTPIVSHIRTTVS